MSEPLLNGGPDPISEALLPPGVRPSRIPTRVVIDATRRLGWGLADQVLSSVTNFVLGLLVARALPPGEFGAFSIAFVTYTLALGASRALASEPLSVTHSAVDNAEWRRGVRSAGGLAVAMGTGVGVGCLAAGWLMHGSLQAAFLMLGVTMPGLLLQDVWRFAFFAGRRERRAFVNDLVWAILLFPSIALLVGTGRATVGSLILAWGVAGLLRRPWDSPGPRAPFPEDDPELAQRTADSRPTIPWRVRRVRWYIATYRLPRRGDRRGSARPQPFAPACSSSVL